MGCLKITYRNETESPFCGVWKRGEGEKELKDPYDYGARMYMPEIGRFGVHDRFVEKYYDFNPYHYTLNNPIRYIDINGDSTVLPSLGEIFNSVSFILNQDAKNVRAGKAAKALSKFDDKATTFISELLSALGIENLINVDDGEGDILTSVNFHNEDTDARDGKVESINNVDPLIGPPTPTRAGQNLFETIGNGVKTFDASVNFVQGVEGVIGETNNPTPRYDTLRGTSTGDSGEIYNFRIILNEEDTIEALYYVPEGF